MSIFIRSLRTITIFGAAIILALGQPLPAYAATFTVNSNNDVDDGMCDNNHCSLREAINAANANPGPDTILIIGNLFIEPGTPLPPLTDDETTITAPNNVRLVGSSAGPSAGLHIQSSFNQIQGLHIRSFTGTGIWIDGVSTQASGNIIGTNGDGIDDALEGNIIRNNQIGIEIIGSRASDNSVAGNLIGTNPSGTQASPNSSDGISISGANGNLIGTDGDGTSDALERNIISGNGGAGIEIMAGASRNIIAGNYIGTDINGSVPLGNANSGIFLVDADRTRIGPTNTGPSDGSQGNVISDNVGDGIAILRSSNTTVRDNLIGTDASGSAPLGNASHGIEIVPGVSEQAGGNFVGDQSNPGFGNVIAHNGLNGIVLWAADGVLNSPSPFTYNSIHSNGGLGIDLDNDGVTANDPLDADIGPNSFLNFPEVVSASSNNVSTFAEARLVSGLPNQNFRIQFFANGGCDPSGYGEGQIYLGETVTTTDSAGNANTGLVSLSGPTPVGDYLTATASHLANTLPFSTSEFSPCVQVESTSVLTTITTLNIPFEELLIPGFNLPGWAPPLFLLGWILVGAVVGGFLSRGRGLWPFVLGGGGGFLIAITLIGAASLLPLPGAVPIDPDLNEPNGELALEDPTATGAPTEEATLETRLESTATATFTPTFTPTATATLPPPTAVPSETPIPPGSISGTVWNDLNNNGSFDGGEPGLAGVTVNRFNGGCGGGFGFPNPTTTDGSGNYSFQDLAPGTYCITVPITGLPSTTHGWDPTGPDFPENATPSIEVNLGAGENRSQDFGFEEITIS